MLSLIMALGQLVDPGSLVVPGLLCGPWTSFEQGPHCDPQAALWSPGPLYSPGHIVFQGPITAPNPLVVHWPPCCPGPVVVWSPWLPFGPRALL